MIIEAQRVENGLFIPIESQSKFCRQDKIILDIHVVEPNQKELEKRHKNGYLLKPVNDDEFGDWEEEQVWPE